MSFPSGSTLLVTLLNGASPNTGPFDLYINSISSSTNLITTASVSKTQLSSSGYTFNNNVEVFSVWAKSSGSITTANVASLTNVPGASKSISVTGSYDSSLTAGQITASIFLDNGYGLQTAGTVNSALNTCPSTTGIGTGSINNIYNTLIVVKESESGSNYLKFFANNAAASTYFYHLPAPTSSGGAVNDVNICIDLSGGNYQATASSAVNVYPTASISSTLNKTTRTGIYNDAWVVIKSNGATILSSSIESTSNFTVPGNAFVEVTSSMIYDYNTYPSTSGSAFVSTMSLSNNFSYNPNEYVSNPTLATGSQILSLGTSSYTNTLQRSFYAVPGGSYAIGATSTFSGPLVVSWSYQFPSCAGDLFEVLQNGSTIVQVTATSSGSFIAKAGDLIEVFNLTGASGTNQCSTGSVVLYRNGDVSTGQLVFYNTEIGTAVEASGSYTIPTISSTTENIYIYGGNPIPS